MKIIINNAQYLIIKLLGHGKGGYSYLVEKNNKLFVAKKIHHEPCSYYTFGNKLQSEINDYNTLKKINITVPTLLEIDYENEIILKEYIEGETIDYYVLNNKMKEVYYNQIKDICTILYKNNLNIDYYPTNFVVQNDILYYIDYECNVYSNEWNFENWGIKYWYKTIEFSKNFKKRA